MTDVAQGSSRVERYGAVVLRWRWLVMAMTVVVVLVLAAGGSRLTLTNDSRVFFSEDNPQLLALEALENTYTETNNIFIAVAPKSGDVFTRETLGAIEALTEQAWLVPYSNRVDSLTNFSHSWADGDDLIVEDLVSDAASLDEVDLARVKDIALSEIALVNRLLAPDGSAAAININTLMPENSDQAVDEIMRHIDPMIEQARADYPDLDFYLTGGVVTSKAFGQATLDDMSVLGPIIVLVIIVAMTLLLRSINGTIATLIIVISSAVAAMGIAGWIGMKLDTGNAGAPTIIMTVAIAHSVHVISTMLQGMRRGLPKREAIVESLRVNFHPVFLTTLTTAIGFLSMNASDAPPFRALGNLVALGVVSAFIFSMTFLPAFLSILPIRVKPRPEGRSEFFDKFGRFVVNRRTPLLWGMAVLIIGLASGIPQLDLNDNWTKYFDERYQFRQDTDFIVEHITGVEAFEYSLSAGEEGGITKPAYLQKVEEFANWYREQPKVVHVSTLTDTMKRLNQNMHGDDTSYYRIPDDPALAAQYLLLYELSLPFGRDLNDQIDVAKSATRMTVIGRNMSAKEQRETDDRAVQWLQDNAPEEMVTEASGLSMMFAYISQRNIEGMLRGTIVAMALISLILIFALRSWRIGLISLVPNFVPAAMSFGLWGYLIGEVGVAASVVTAVTFGIVVDDTIHFLSKYLRARREQGLDTQAAVRYAFRTVGHALWTTTAVLAAGFIVLATSGFQVNWSLGLLTAMTIAIALLADFFFLPPMLMIIDGRKK